MIEGRAPQEPDLVPKAIEAERDALIDEIRYGYGDPGIEVDADGLIVSVVSRDMGRSVLQEAMERHDQV